LLDKKTVIVYGSGFSKAMFGLPVLSELSGFVWEELSDSDRSQIPSIFKEDVEEMMTYLYTQQPWQDLESYSRNKAVFYRIQKEILKVLNRSKIDRVPDIGDAQTNLFLDFIHDQSVSNITFNYDCILEGLLSDNKSRKKVMSCFSMQKDPGVMCQLNLEFESSLR
jgi:hypothetical protein